MQIDDARPIVAVPTAHKADEALQAGVAILGGA